MKTLCFSVVYYIAIDICNSLVIYYSLTQSYINSLKKRIRTIRETGGKKDTLTAASPLLSSLMLTPNLQIPFNKIDFGLLTVQFRKYLIIQARSESVCVWGGVVLTFFYNSLSKFFPKHTVLLLRRVLVKFW